MHSQSKKRLDEELVDRGLYASRARARDAIARGCVSLEDAGTPKPSRMVSGSTKISISDPALQYVSRAALKLKHALKVTGFSPEGKTALDLGASTGGFCQVLLEAGAKRVFAVDVGHGQLVEKIANHPCITNLENLNARELSLKHLNDINPDFLTSDMSFISLKLALPNALQLAAPDAYGIFLVKPQFEVGKENLSRDGIVKDQQLATRTANDMKDWLDNNEGWRATHLIESPLKGGDGNKEFLLAGRKHG